MWKAYGVDTPKTSSDPLSDPTRARLFAALGELRRAARTSELADLVGLHVNGVRRQLEQLERAGLVDRFKVVSGRGRPRDEWSISPSAEPANQRPTGYAELAGWLARSITPSKRQLREVERNGREIGREMAPGATDDLARSFEQALSALGFQPSIQRTDGGFACTLRNCPYRDSARANQELICTFHRGLTAGLLDRFAPDAKLTRFEPHPPDRAGCLVGVDHVAGDD